MKYTIEMDEVWQLEILAPLAEMIAHDHNRLSGQMEERLARAIPTLIFCLETWLIHNPLRENPKAWENIAELIAQLDVTEKRNGLSNI